ncbi:YciI family protein [Mucilaginibacter sp. cycad4]|uniref:YciI family protein n=1 Tax=Mucilaginibacter sp. cycad4 TaxID=3342096 RepID=UPI002AAC3B71|nr:YciI family protein [Mucilaginibacter gossypii]WPV00424.1 YciI family protein [Mucilaginibacter gossypii]
MKKHFVIKLTGNRPTFPNDMTDDERIIMQAHSEYLKGKMNEGLVLIFGPVFDPKGVYGLGILAVDDEAQVKEIIANDPANVLGTYEVALMMALMPA